MSTFYINYFSLGAVLLVTIEYLMMANSPSTPFSVGRHSLHQHASVGFSIEHLESIDTWRADSPLAGEGVTELDTRI